MVSQTYARSPPYREAGVGGGFHHTWLPYGSRNMHTEAIIDDSVLVLKAPPGLSVPPSDYPFEHAFPITDGLSISMAQSPLTGLDRMTQPDRTNPAEAGADIVRRKRTHI